MTTITLTIIANPSAIVKTYVCSRSGNIVSVVAESSRTQSPLTPAAVIAGNAENGEETTPASEHIYLYIFSYVIIKIPHESIPLRAIRASRHLTIHFSLARTSAGRN